MKNNKNNAVNRREMMGSLMLASGAALTELGFTKKGTALKKRGFTTLEGLENVPRGLSEAIKFPLIEALYGRRARRFSMGAEIADGVMKYKSKHKPEPLTRLQQMMVLTAATGNTGWHHMIYRNQKYAPHLANYAMAAGGRTFPSAAGFHTTEFFFTDDNGSYFLPTRDSGSLVKKEKGEFDLQHWLEAHEKRIVKLSDGRLNIPAKEPFMDGHNTWCVNAPGSTLLIPVADIAQHMLGSLCFLVQNGACIYDDTNNRKIPGMEKFKNLVDVENPYPLSYVEQMSLTEATAEMSTACYAGMLMLQATGLGGWMFDGLDRFSLLGASGDPQVPGLGFVSNKVENSPFPNITGLPGVFESYCPPHYKDMSEAVKALVKRKFGQDGPFNKNTAGPWKESSKVRSAAQFHSPEFQECVATMAQYIFDTFGKFPASVPAVYCLTYLQAHHLDLEFYDHFHQEGSYLYTHKNRKKWWAT
ncbi:hypothetical protein MUK70_04120 [Dyadobacter chenwenxiniae]|uniref:Uncharacterized protein n=1 Tax=Dyadobacter chenwenxiniae TaxID=2906456 RepID=A0A9X1TH55_9BACT|nr:hypothetical protein [Dyadobacter chenwenxiniae]MCF0064767.1 hypothetical protein [Dyadobacter chenwenxiniae]UON84178.1 hypothetical protein MUK70_04120 [Dyadobacter chenwenxiniae]